MKRNDKGAKPNCLYCHGTGFFWQWLRPDLRVRKICGCVKDEDARKALKKEAEGDAGS